jgi:hypothetical protein
MLARRAKGQKPRPALGFQNAKRGLLETKSKTTWARQSPQLCNYGFAGVAVGADAAAAGGAPPPPPSFGVAR